MAIDRIDSYQLSTKGGGKISKYSAAAVDFPSRPGPPSRRRRRRWRLPGIPSWDLHVGHLTKPSIDVTGSPRATFGTKKTIKKIKKVDVPPANHACARLPGIGIFSALWCDPFFWGCSLLFASPSIIVTGLAVRRPQF